MSNYIQILSSMGYKVDLLLTGIQPEVKFDYKYGQVFRCELSRKFTTSLLLELFLRKPYCCKNLFEVDGDYSKVLTNSYEILLASPISQVHFANRLTEDFVRRGAERPKLISATSDCYTAELFVGTSASEKLHQDVVLKKFVSKLRSLIMSKLEPQLLANSDAIFVQSKRDKAWLTKLGKGRLKRKIRIVTNGVDEKLFSLTLRDTLATKFGFVADLNNVFYRQKLIWFYKDVWSLRSRTNTELLLYTKPVYFNSDELEKIASDPSIHIVDKFFDDVADIYSQFDVSLAPIFKSYGFINKVGESMAAGVPVVGDITAFNAIPGFKPGKHGLVANDASEMICAIDERTTDLELMQQIKLNARELAAKELRWQKHERVFSEIRDL